MTDLAGTLNQDLLDAPAFSFPQTDISDELQKLLVWYVLGGTVGSGKTENLVQWRNQYKFPEYPLYSASHPFPTQEPKLVGSLRTGHITSIVTEA